MGSGALLPRCADHVGWALLTTGASGHGCFLAVKPNQPEDDGEYGVPDLALPNVALPIARGQRGCLTKNPQSARPLVCGHEREANGTKQGKRGAHRQTFSSPPTMPALGPFDYDRKLQTDTLPSWRLRPTHPIGSPTNPRLGWKNAWFGGQKTRAPAGALVTHHADEQQSDDRPPCIAKS